MGGSASRAWFILLVLFLFAAAADQALVYPEGAVDFVAYYPYTATVTENKVPLKAWLSNLKAMV